jgi:hypothetical protein
MPTVRLTESEITTVAYQLWLERGSPVGTDQEDWFRAEAMLSDTRTESEFPTPFVLEGWPGHWEIWESEWVCAHWVRDVLGAGIGARVEPGVAAGVEPSVAASRCQAA